MVPRTVVRLVGREREFGAVQEALARASRDEGARLMTVVTLTGPVGVGKSALARRVAAELGQRGVFEEVEHLDASSAGSGAALPLAWARREPRRGGETCLLVVDGCDDAVVAQSLIDHLLREEPAAQLLLTACTPLRVEGEIVVEVAPLPTPTGDDPEGVALDCLATFLPEGAAAALVARDRPALAALLRELDGLPLAMALAAPRLAVMEARVLLHRLQRSRSILERPDADATGRRPFETALASATQALSPRAQAGLAALTSVVGGATIDALEAIVGPPSVAGDPRALDVIVELRERSLLVGGGTDGEPPRLAMLRCVRDVVVRSASAAALEVGRERHAAHYADLAEALQRRAAAGDEGGARHALVADRANFVAVLERVASSASSASPTSARRALRLLVAVYAVPGALPPATFLPLIDAAVDRTKDSGAEPVLIAQALLVRARASRAAGDPRSATRDLLRVLHVALPTRRRDVEAEATSELAHLFAARGDLEAAVEHARRASLAFRETGDRTREAIAAAQVGDLERRRGDMAAARDALDRALPLASATPGGIPAEVLEAAFRLQLEVQDEKGLHATLALARARPTSTEGEGRQGSLLLVEAVALHDEGELLAARERYGAATDAARHAGARAVEAESALFDGVAALALGRRGEALARFRVAVDLAGHGVLASHVVELARSVAFALDAWTTPAWRGAPPPEGASHFARELVRGADGARSFEALRATLAEDGDDRVFARLFARAVGGRVPKTSGQDVDVARFDVDGRWFRLPAEPIVSLERRRPLGAMVKLLVAERLARPGSPVTVSQLLAAGWAGERVQADAGAHRVRVALSTLRKLGLRTLLLTTPEGYALDPARKVTTESEVEG